MSSGSAHLANEPKPAEAEEEARAPEPGPGEGTVIGGRYRLMGLIGAGSFGEVRRALDLGDGKTIVAAKRFYKLPEDEDDGARFWREASLQFRLRHPNIARVLGIVTESAGYGNFTIAEYVHGGNLRGFLQRRVKAGVGESARILQQVAMALAHAHDRRIIHRDIKPENILLDYGPGAEPTDGVDPVPKITDFGLARHLSPGDMSTTHHGSPAYMAPEQFYEEYSFESDIYALGVLLHELVSGKRPFYGDARELMRSHIFEAPPEIADAPAEARGLLRRLLAKDPLDRPATMRETADLLGELARSMEGREAPPPPSAPAVAAVAAPTPADASPPPNPSPAAERRPASPRVESRTIAAAEFAWTWSASPPLEARWIGSLGGEIVAAGPQGVAARPARPVGGEEPFRIIDRPTTPLSFAAFSACGAMAALDGDGVLWLRRSLAGAPSRDDRAADALRRAAAEAGSDAEPWRMALSADGLWTMFYRAGVSRVLLSGPDGAIERLDLGFGESPLRVAADRSGWFRVSGATLPRRTKSVSLAAKRAVEAEVRAWPVCAMGEDGRGAAWRAKFRADEKRASLAPFGLEGPAGSVRYDVRWDEPKPPSLLAVGRGWAALAGGRLLSLAALERPGCCRSLRLELQGELVDLRSIDGDGLVALRRSESGGVVHFLGAARVAIRAALLRRADETPTEEEERDV